MHVKGFTKLNPHIPEATRGTFAGLAHSRVANYLRTLGVTSAELLPIHAFVDDSYLDRQGPQELLGLQLDRHFSRRSRAICIRRSPASSRKW